MSLFIGLLSGTSADAVDAALVEFKPDQSLCIVDSLSSPYPPHLREQILSLYQPGDNELDRMGELHHQLGLFFAHCVNQLLQQSNTPAQSVSAIGSHGQTVRHRPRRGDNWPFTLQLGDAHHIAEQTGITTIADFRGRDMACGGQGAPLASSLHNALFRHSSLNRAILNIGGIANLTYLAANGTLLGFDTGPGNGLMDAWISKHQNKQYDAGGQWAASGQVLANLLELLMAEDYFAKAAPKSTGREEFSFSWLEQKLEQAQAQHEQAFQAQDVQATLLELSAQSINQAIDQSCCQGLDELYICGGGIRNGELIKRIQALKPRLAIHSTQAFGLAPDWVEAATFAWLAKQNLAAMTGNEPAVTGAKTSCILGAIYPGKDYQGLL